MITFLSEQECVHFLANNYLGYLSYISNQHPYVVPITYYFDGENSIICYSSEGHKTDALRLNNKISLLTSDIQNINNWKSVQAKGICEEMKGSSIKACLHKFTLGIKKIANKSDDVEFGFLKDFSNSSINIKCTSIFKIHLINIIGKSQTMN